MKKVIFVAIISIVTTLNSNATTLIKKTAPTKLFTDCIAEASYKMSQYEAVYGCLTSEQYNFKFRQFFNQCQNRSIQPLQK
jgi:hypothetical protein